MSSLIAITIGFGLSFIVKNPSNITKTILEIIAWSF